MVNMQTEDACGRYFFFGCWPQLLSFCIDQKSKLRLTWQRAPVSGVAWLQTSGQKSSWFPTSYSFEISIKSVDFVRVCDCVRTSMLLSPTNQIFSSSLSCNFSFLLFCPRPFCHFQHIQDAGIKINGIKIRVEVRTLNQWSALSLLCSQAHRTFEGTLVWGERHLQRKDGIWEIKHFQGLGQRLDAIWIFLQLVLSEISKFRSKPCFS